MPAYTPPAYTVEPTALWQCHAGVLYRAAPDSGPLLVPPANAAATPGVPPGAAPARATPAGTAAPAAAYVPPPATATPPGIPRPSPAATPSSSAVVTTTASAAAAKPKPDDEGGFDWSDLDFDAWWKKVEKAFGYGPDEKIAREQFREAEALFRAKKYAEAAPKFYIASWRWPDSAMEENAMFLEGECYYFDDQYGKAQDAYDMLLKKHGNTRYLDTVTWRMLAIARYWEECEKADPHWPTTPNFTDKTRPWFDAWENAISAYESIHLHDPRGPLADFAVISIANMYFREGYYEDASFNYDIIRKDYPKSKYQLKAHILGLQSKMKSYQGPNYNGQPLKDAAEIADQTLTQFRGRLGDEEARVVETRAKIVVMKAEREWTLGQYYDHKQYYAAARQYYKFLVDNYPRTPLPIRPAPAWSRSAIYPTRRPIISSG